MKAIEIIETIENYAPLSLQESWDKSGLQIGDCNKEVNKVMIALNCDTETISKCVKEGCQMLVTHHPFLLDEVTNYASDNFVTKVLDIALKNQIVVYSAHTSLDCTLMNKWLIESLDIDQHHEFNNCKMCEIGTLNRTYYKEAFIEMVKEAYHLEHLKYAGNKEMISKVAVLGGSGADLLSELYGEVDAFITGDSKYRHAKNAFDHDILLVDINHHSESIMVDHLKELLEKELSVEIVGYHADDYYTYL